MEGGLLVSLKYFFLALAGAFGSIAYTVLEWRKGTIKGLPDAIALSFLSYFAGFVWCLLSLEYFPDRFFLQLFAFAFGCFVSITGLLVLRDKIFNLISKQ